MRWLAPILLLPVVAHADSFSAKVIGVADGDTITVLRGKKPLRIRLHGVDTPERAQPFGQRAKQFTSKLVFGKQVEVEVKAKDRYGRTVGVVFVEAGESFDDYNDGSFKIIKVHQCLNDELVKAGLAWWYRRYAPKHPTLGKYEAAARKAKRGLWADKAPVAPWDWRQGKRTPPPKSGSPARCAADTDCFLKLCCCSWEALVKGAPEPAACAHACRCRGGPQPRPRGVKCAAGRCEALAPGCYDLCLRRSRAHAISWEAIEARCQARCASRISVKPMPPKALRCNVMSKVCHRPGCRRYRCKNCTATFETAAEAKAKGYRVHRGR